MKKITIIIVFVIICCLVIFTACGNVNNNSNNNIDSIIDTDDELTKAASERFPDAQELRLLVRRCLGILLQGGERGELHGQH